MNADPDVLDQQPRLLGNAFEAAAGADDAAAGGGAAWRLRPEPRQLDSNVIRLRPGGRIDSHVGPDLDVLVLVLAGDGQVVGEADAVPLTEGALVWLPRRSRRAIEAGEQGLSYLTVHRKRPGLSIAGTG
jgi:quercetin dioxygenase-like cupin family protein